VHNLYSLHGREWGLHGHDLITENLYSPKMVEHSLIIKRKKF